MSVTSGYQRLTADERSGMRGDCENCYGLCCVALSFAASADFAVDKNAGEACRHLQPDFRCGIHTILRECGFRGCTVYDCFGAGQMVSHVTYGGIDWRQNPDSAKQMFEVFSVMRQLHELLWYLKEAMTMQATSSLYGELDRILGETEQLTHLGPEALLELDVEAHWAEVNELLLQTSELVHETARRQHRGSLKTPRKVGRGADLIGANLRGADLRFVNMRGAYLIAADLRGADLSGADLIGADFRDADIRGANLAGSLFLTQSQLQAAKGNARTKLPPFLVRPDHWPVS